MRIARGGALEYVDLPGRRSADPFRDDGADVSVRVVAIAPDVRRSPHRHPLSSEVVYVIGGHGRMWQDGDVADVEVGDVAHIPAGTPHATLAVGGTLLLVCFFPHPRLGDNIEELTDIVLPHADELGA
jgi:quercetin dioxygenase-like cupin family protein